MKIDAFPGVLTKQKKGYAYAYVLTDEQREWLCRRYNALRRGYILMQDCSDEGGERYNIYYDEQTQRSEAFEQNLQQDGFHVLQWK